MAWNLLGTHAAEGDLAELVGLRHKLFIIELRKGQTLQTHRGVLKHDDLIGKPWGCQVQSHMGSPFFLLQPGLSELLRSSPRISQILYPKDIGFILVRLGIGPGLTVIEAGTGSGSFTAALAWAVSATGKVISYDVREDMQKVARSNLEKLGMSARVDFKLKDIGQGFDEKNVDVLFLDLPNPYDYMQQARNALKPGGFFGALLPTVNQVSRLLSELRRNNFAFVDVVEILMRFYKPEADRLRPVDRMVAHTGYLIFARPISATQEDSTETLLVEEYRNSSLEDL